MYPTRVRISTIIPWLFHDWLDSATSEPASRKKKAKGKPAFILSQDAVLNEMDIRQALREPLEHPQDLWRFENLERHAPKLARKVTRGRNGVVLQEGISLCDNADPDLVAKVQAEEEKVAQATASLRLLEQLDAAAKLLKRAIHHRRGPLDATKTLHTRAATILRDVLATSLVD